MPKPVPPISLRDLVEQFSIEALRPVVASLPGFQPAEPKNNEIWRYVRGHICTVIAYRSSIVIGGLYLSDMRGVEALIRQRAQPSAAQQLAASEAVHAALHFVREQIAYRGHSALNAEALADVIAYWRSLDSVSLALAQRGMRENNAISTQKWYNNALEAIICSYRLGLQAIEVPA